MFEKAKAVSGQASAGTALGMARALPVRPIPRAVVFISISHRPEAEEVESVPSHNIDAYLVVLSPSAAFFRLRVGMGMATGRCQLTHATIVIVNYPAVYAA